MRLHKPSLAVLFLTALSAGAAAEAGEWKASSWRRADALFRSDPRWLGADAAFSVPLGGDRVLWLFGDTFIGDGKVKRAKSSMIHNSIGVSQGPDPSRAEIRFHWRTNAGRPGSYFPEEDGTWLWPLHGLLRGKALTLFFMRVEASDKGLGFNVIGSTALRCDDASGDPEGWRFRALELGVAPVNLSLIYGVAVLAEDERVYAYCTEAPGDHDTYLARWRVEDFDRGELRSPEWWDGKEFVPQTELPGAPAVVIPRAATEFSVHRLPDGRYVQVQSLGFGATEIGLRFAPRPEGPWPRRAERVYRPRESRGKGAFVYAGKAHPELSGADLIVTYAANHMDSRKLLRSRSLYYPRFVRLDLKSRGRC